MLIDDFDRLKLPKSVKKPTTLLLATSVAGQRALEYVCKKLNTIKNLTCKVKPVKSYYWGEEITVAGLITSDDLVRTIKEEECDYVSIPGVMLKPYTEMFLDGNDLNYVKKETGKEFIVSWEQYSLKELVDFLKTI